MLTAKEAKQKSSQRFAEIAPKHYEKFLSKVEEKIQLAIKDGRHSIWINVHDVRVDLLTYSIQQIHKLDYETTFVSTKTLEIKW